MQFFDADTVHRTLHYPELIEALVRHHKTDVDQNQSILLEEASAGRETNYFLTLPAWRHGKAVAAKLVTVFPENEKNGSGLPSVHAVVALFDGSDGRPLAIVDGTALTLRKTAADSGMGTYFLAPPEPRHLLMVGAGAMAPHLIMAHCAARPSIRHVDIWNRTSERAVKLSRELEMPGVEVSVVNDLEVPARQADVISCATMSAEPLILGSWLKPGAHLDLVGSFRPDMRECDEEALARGSVFVDSRWSAVADCGELVQALERGLLTDKDILADAFQLARNEHPGRTSDDEITVFKNGGGGHLDLMVAQYLAGLS